MSLGLCVGFCDKPFFLETDASKLGLGAVLLQKQPDGKYHSVTYMSWSLPIHEHNYHSTKQGYLALKWAIAEQFEEYLHWKLFVVTIDNNPFTYILTTPNLDTTWHFWVESLAGFTFGLKYQKERDNAVQILWAVLDKCWMQKLWNPSWEVSL